MTMFQNSILNHLNWHQLENSNIVLQYQYYKIYSYFKTTVEPFDELLWDGNSLLVILHNEVIEEYSYNDLKQLIHSF